MVLLMDWVSFLVRTKSECGNHRNTSYAVFLWQMRNFWNLHTPKAFSIRPPMYHHVCFYLSFIPLTHQEEICVAFRVVLFKHVQEKSYISILCLSSPATVVICLETICLTGDCSNTPGDLWQTRLPAAWLNVWVSTLVFAKGCEDAAETFSTEAASKQTNHELLMQKKKRQTSEP